MTTEAKKPKTVEKPKFEKCPNCGSKVKYEEHCYSCTKCDWGVCV